MNKSSSFFRAIPIDSPVHRLAAESKVLAGIFVSIGLVFNTEWSHIGVAVFVIGGMLPIVWFVVSRWRNLKPAQTVQEQFVVPPTVLAAPAVAATAPGPLHKDGDAS